MTTDSFKNEMLVCTVLYRMIEQDELFPLILEGTPYEFIDDTLTFMLKHKLIEVAPDKLHYKPSAKGIALRNKLVEMYDETLKFDIFANVNLGLEMPEELCADGALVYNDCYDTRFAIPDTDEEADQWGSEDMRLAIFDFMANATGQKEANLPRIVFLQLLADGMLKDDQIWFELQLGTPFATIQDIIDSAYGWRDVAENEDEAKAIMHTIYSAGLIEAYKQDNRDCEDCGIPLAMYDLEAKEKGQPLTHCPNEECDALLPKDSSNVDGFVDFFEPKSRTSTLSLLAAPLY